MNFAKLTVIRNFFTPTTFFILAIVLSFKMSFHGQYLHDYFLKSVIDKSIHINSQTSNLSLKGFTLSNSNVNLDGVNIGTINSINITPKITKLFSGKINSIKATSGNIILNEVTIPQILMSKGIDLPIRNILLDDLKLDIFGTFFTLKSIESGWLIQNSGNESVTITTNDNNFQISSHLFTLPYITLANLNGTYSSKSGLKISGNISPLKSNFDMTLKKESSIIDISGHITANQIQLGNITGAYNMGNCSYTLNADLKEIPFSLFEKIFKSHFDLQLSFINSGLIGLNYQISQGLNTHINSFHMNLTNLKAKFYLYDLFGINGIISLTQNNGETAINISIDSIRRHKLNLQNTVVLMIHTPDLGLTPSIVTTEYAQGSVKLHDFKQTDNGLEATAEIDNLDINDAITHSSITTLAATGKLKGTARLLLTTEKIIILNAKLNAASPKGKIHYFPKLANTDDTKSSQAMENLDYTILNIDLNTADINEPADVKIQIVGTNPTLSNGYPLDFTIETKATLMDFY
jgi:hypothetical protein